MGRANCEKIVVDKDYTKNLKSIFYVILFEKFINRWICKKETIPAAVWGSVNRPAAGPSAAGNGR